jgi:parallel beta-helix repeat protein
MAQLYVDGKPMLLARSPNIADDGTWMWYGYEHFKSPTNTAFVLDDPVAAHAMIPALNSSYGSAGLWIHGFFKFDWRDTYIKIDSVVEDGTTGAFTVTNDPKTPPQYPFTAGARFYAVGSLEFLDQKGEYYIDKVNGTVRVFRQERTLEDASSEHACDQWDSSRVSTFLTGWHFIFRPNTEGMLYFYPLEPLAAGTDVVVSHLPQVLSNTGASHTTFENLVISDATGDVVQVENANNVTISDSTVSNGGGACMAVSGSNNTLAHNTIFGCGGQGISVSSGDVHTLEHGGTSVVGNTITNFSLIVRTYQAGIGFSGVGLYVRCAFSKEIYTRGSIGSHVCSLEALACM